MSFNYEINQYTQKRGADEIKFVNMLAVSPFMHFSMNKSLDSSCCILCHINVMWSVNQIRQFRQCLIMVVSLFNRTSLLHELS